ncbi:hypothetical protein C4J81_05610 [Deltaproteobacteria bacterium Smac51]|nr:hypothetical protein C4J81_05610 [Deltaproteobacteria bacterium Smac51]
MFSIRSAKWLLISKTTAAIPASSLTAKNLSRPRRRTAAAAPAVADNLPNNPARPEDVKLFRSVADVAPTLWEDALAVEPAVVVRNSGVRFEDGRGFIVPFMNGNYIVDLKARTIETPPGHKPAGFQKGLVLLTYLAKAQDLGLSGKMVTSRELNGGAMFFTGPHALMTEPVTEKFGAAPEDFLARAEALGFKPENQGAGFACRGLVLPHIAVGCVLHSEDDEFPAELTYTFDSYSHYHMPLDGLWAMINVLAEELAA